MRILFCGGGTAGHVMPAIAMAEILVRKKENIEVAFVGRENGNENRSILKEGYKLYTIDVIGISRSLSFKNVKAIIKVIKSGRMARRIISDFSPDIVIGTGGYVCYPLIKAAQAMGIPTMIHESNIYPGLVTRLLGKKCDRLLLNSEGAKKHLKHTENTLVIGNPLRVNFSAISREHARNQLKLKKSDFFVLSFGGSLGSDVLNQNIIEVMNNYSALKKDVIHTHATGISRYSDIKNAHPLLCTGSNGCKITPYIDNMPIYLKAADLVICRSGAMTISELSLVGVSAILVPSPNVAENHQYENAKYVSDRGAAVMLPENELNLKTLTTAIENIKLHPEVRKKMIAEIRFLSRCDTENLLIKAINDIF